MFKLKYSRLTGFLFNAKVKNAEDYKTVGYLIYGDPKEYASVPSRKYPNGRWLSDDGVQRGSIAANTCDGDPMTEGYPSKRKKFYSTTIK